MAQDPYKYFRPEASELVDQFARGVLDLEKGATGKTAVAHLLRLAHTLKGAARVVKQTEVANRAHAIEDALAPFRDSTDPLGRTDIDLLLEHLDAISAELATLTPPSPPAASPGLAADGQADVSLQLRAGQPDLTEADAVLVGVAETHVLIGALRDVARGVEQTRLLADQLLTAWPAHGAADTTPYAGTYADGRDVVAGELRRQVGVVERRLGSAIDQIDRELRQVRESAERLRLVPAACLFTTLERCARDTAHALAKQVAFEGSGGDIRLDAPVLAVVQPALVQLVRNAVAHGIEAEPTRHAAGKTRAGRVSVRVSRRGSRIVFACHDDGAGVDVDAVRRMAAQRGLIVSNRGRGGADDIVDILLRGGISTASTVTKASGRGIGLDIVREAVERLNAELGLDTAPGLGTTFELIIPPSLASVDALLFQTGNLGATAAIPLDAVRGTLRLVAGDISQSAAGASIRYRDNAIAFLPLGTALSGKGWSSERAWTAIVVHASDSLAAIGVRRLLGIGKIVMQPLPSGMRTSPIVIGAALDAGGSPQLVLDAEALVAAAQRAQAFALAPEPARPPVLVVDDSLTTRMLEQNILESAGYAVDVAISGEDALARVRDKRYALILCDVEMAGMDGFRFIERIRTNPASSDVPAILVTSCAQPEYRQRGRDVGAQGYIVKGEFDQSKLLNMIAPLIADATSA